MPEIQIFNRYKLKENPYAYWHITHKRIQEEIALIEAKEVISEVTVFE